MLLLYRAKLRLSQKLGLTTMLSLSVVMIATAVTRVSLAFLPSGLPDQVEQMFFIVLEGQVAIIMISLTAFRSLFVQDSSKQFRSPEIPQVSPNVRTPDRQRTWPGPKVREHWWPSLPSATMTGMRTMIGQGPKKTTSSWLSKPSQGLSSVSEEPGWPLEDNGIQVKREIDQVCRFFLSFFLPFDRANLEMVRYQPDFGD